MRRIIEIIDVLGREILDSRSNPTIEVEVHLEDGIIGRTVVPSGAPIGVYEVCELRDGGKSCYLGKGVLTVTEDVSTDIIECLMGVSALDQAAIDEALIELDDTSNKTKLGANAVLSTSLACAKAAVKVLGTSLYNYVGGTSTKVLPMPTMNILNGDTHATNNMGIQEFMIMPVGACCFHETLRMCAGVSHTLKNVLKESDTSTVGVGDEGGYASSLKKDEDTLKIIIKVIEKTSYKPGEDFKIAIDTVSSEQWNEEEKCYIQLESGEKLTQQQLVNMWKELVDTYPIASLEDGMAKTDWKSWATLTKAIDDRIQLVDDNLFVTNTERLKTGIEKKMGDAILVKTDQIGTLTEALDVIQMANQAGYTTIVSHHSGGTKDTIITDIAVTVNTDQIKTNVSNRIGRVAKYNQLLHIEEELGDVAQYLGTNTFLSLK